MPFRKNPQKGGCFSLHIPRSLSPHFPPVFNHCLHTFLVPFSDQLLDNDELRDLDALDPGTNPVELPDLDELLEKDRRSLLLENLLLVYGLGDADFLGECLFPEGFPDPFPDGVTLNAFPRGVDDLPRPFDLGLCLGVPAREEDLLA